MIWLRLIIIVVIPLIAVYYGMVVLQCFGVIKFTKREITFGRCLVPFYYWIAPEEEKETKKFSDYADEDETDEQSKK